MPGTSGSFPPKNFIFRAFFRWLNRASRKRKLQQNEKTLDPDTISSYPFCHAKTRNRNFIMNQDIYNQTGISAITQMCMGMIMMMEGDI